MESLNAFLPKEWSHNNPIDILGDATPERYAKAVEIVAQRSQHGRPARDPHPAVDD